MGLLSGFKTWKSSVQRKLLTEIKMLSILGVFGLFIATSNAYILLYPIQAPIYTMPVFSKTVQAPSAPVNRIGPAIAPVVVNFADYDCSGGDGTYPDFESGCETYYVCSGDRAWSYTCNQNMYFDASIGHCNVGSKVNEKCNSDLAPNENGTSEIAK